MRKTAARKVALYGILGGAMFAAKMAMAALPNVEPVSLLAMLYAVCFGWEGLYAVYIYVFLEYAMWGLHYWAICYLYVWLVLFVLARLLRRAEHPLIWAALSGSFGLLFGGLCAIVYFFVGGWAYAVSWWTAGLSADLVHGTANFIIALLLFKPLRGLLEKLYERYQK